MPSSVTEMGTVAPSLVQMARPLVSCKSDRNFCISLLLVPLSGCVRSTGVTNASEDCPGTVRFTAGPFRSLVSYETSSL